MKKNWRKKGLNLNSPKIEKLVADPAERAARAQEKQRLVVHWLQAEGFSTAEVLAEVLGVHKNAVYRTLNVLQERGLLVAERLKMPLGARPAQVWGLTPDGALCVMNEAGDFEHYQPGRQAPATVQHSLDVQRVRLVGERSGWSGWKSEKTLAREGAKAGWRKIPDAVATSPDGRTAAIEVERTAKTLKRYRDIVRDYLLMMQEGRLARVLYICTGNVRADALQRLISKVDYVTVNGQQMQVKDAHRARFSFIDFEDFKQNPVLKTEGA